MMYINQDLDVFFCFCLLARICGSDSAGSAVSVNFNYVPPTFTENCPPQGLSRSYTAPPGKDFVILKWTDPVAKDQYGNTVRVEQVAGVKNGGAFIGSVNDQRHQIVYIATASNGLKNNCYFVIYVTIPECPRLGVVKNGHYRCTDGLSPDSSCMFTCDEGYVLNENGNITCEYISSALHTSPAWSGTRQCERVNCSEPTLPENAKIYCTSGGYGYHSVCHVQCRQGYMPSGPLYMICQADGYWSEPTRCLKNEVLELQCSSAQCNGHTCILFRNQTMVCNCSNGWSGQTCEQPPDYCRHNICMNNGSCINQYFAYNCSCPRYYSGVLCQISPVDGFWSDWTVWSSCSRTCGLGDQTRFRFCDSPSPGQVGKNCEGERFDKKTCHLSNCKVCPPLKQYNGSRSTYHCEIYDNYDQERCQVICENGTVLLAQFKQFDEILCGWPTNNNWIPANIQPSCVAPVPPKGLRLETRISYNSLIPEELENTFKEEVLAHLQPTDCFTSTMTKCNAYVQFSNTSSKSRGVITNLAITFEILLESRIRKRASVYIAADGGVSIEEARHVLEETAEYIKNFTGKIFDIRLDDTEFISNKTSLDMSTATVCEEGSVPYDDLCVTCPVGTFATSEQCEFCEKGYYQDRKGQSKCEPCSAGKTTVQPGAIRPYECTEPKLKVNNLDRTKDIVTIVVSVVSPIVSLIIAIPAFIKVYQKCSEKRGQKYGSGREREENDECDDQATTDLQTFIRPGSSENKHKKEKRRKKCRGGHEQEENDEFDDLVTVYNLVDSELKREID